MIYKKSTAKTELLGNFENKMNRQKQIEEKGFIISVANDFQFIPNSSK